MAKNIAPTPLLTGKWADEFIKEFDRPRTKTELMAIKEVYKDIKTKFVKF